jgi:hypothetical protein
MNDLLVQWKAIEENVSNGEKGDVSKFGTDIKREAVETSAKSSICKIILIYFEKIEKSYTNFKRKQQSSLFSDIISMEIRQLKQ